MYCDFPNLAKNKIVKPVFIKYVVNKKLYNFYDLNAKVRS